MISREEYSEERMDALVLSINKLTKGLVIKKPKKKKRVYMDIDSETYLQLKDVSHVKETSLQAGLDSSEKSAEVKEEELNARPSTEEVPGEGCDYMSKAMLFQELPFLNYLKSKESFPMQMSQSTLDCAQSYMFAQHFGSCGFLPTGSSAFLSNMTSSQPQP